MDRKTLLLEHSMVVNEGRPLTIEEYPMVLMYLGCEGYILDGPQQCVSVLDDLHWIIATLRERDAVNTGVPLWSGYPHVSEDDFDKALKAAATMNPDDGDHLSQDTLRELITLLWSDPPAKDVDVRLEHLSAQLQGAPYVDEDWKILKLVTQGEVNQWLDTIRSKLEGLL